MDESVLQAIKRWPNVPAVFGWLSLTARGQWRLHPDGKAHEGSLGESISNHQILAFISRNYAHDEQGRWLFQNGPQRVYVRLDAAPWIIFADDSQGTLTTHTGHAVESVSQLAIDQQGHLYLLANHGPAMLIDRDLARFMRGLQTENGQALEDWWASDQSSAHIISTSPKWQGFVGPIAIHKLDCNQPIDLQLGFVANPKSQTD